MTSIYQVLTLSKIFFFAAYPLMKKKDFECISYNHLLNMKLIALGSPELSFTACWCKSLIQYNRKTNKGVQLRKRSTCSPSDGCSVLVPKSIINPNYEDHPTLIHPTTWISRRERVRWWKSLGLCQISVPCPGWEDCCCCALNKVSPTLGVSWIDFLKWIVERGKRNSLHHG